MIKYLRTLTLSRVELLNCSSIPLCISHPLLSPPIPHSSSPTYIPFSAAHDEETTFIVIAPPMPVARPLKRRASPSHDAVDPALNHCEFASHSFFAFNPSSPMLIAPRSFPSDVRLPRLNPLRTSFRAAGSDLSWLANHHQLRPKRNPGNIYSPAFGRCLARWWIGAQCIVS